ncbi:hypothetical protein ACFQHO_49790 [Actinomadura yumaensis]|uniref:hypothetical protein n=1 Tax=Actinomadura yumaensis TaxID=111807 RepID=UPI003613BB52
MPLARPPITRPYTRNPAAHAAIDPRWSRHASASGLRRPGAAVAGPGREDESGAEVAPLDQRVRAAGDEGRRRERQQRHPVAVAAVRPDLLDPPDRRQPRHPPGPRRRVADRADQVRHPDHADGDAARDAGVLGDLGGDGRDGGEERPGADPADAGRDRARGALLGEHGRDEQGERDVGDHGQQQRGGERRAAADDPGPDQLQPPVLLLGAGVPDHQQHAEHAHERGAERAHPPRGQAADGGVVQPPVEREGRGLVVDPVGELLPFGLGLVEARVSGEGAVDRGQQQQDPHRDHDAVAAQPEAQQRPGAGEGGHRFAFSILASLAPSLS